MVRYYEPSAIVLASGGWKEAEVRKFHIVMQDESQSTAEKSGGRDGAGYPLALTCLDYHAAGAAAAGQLGGGSSSSA